MDMNEFDLSEGLFLVMADAEAYSRQIRCFTSFSAAVMCALDHVRIVGKGEELRVIDDRNDPNDMPWPTAWFSLENRGHTPPRFNARGKGWCVSVKPLKVEGSYALNVD